MARKVRAWFRNPRARREKPKCAPSGYSPLHSDTFEVEAAQLNLPPVVPPKPVAPAQYDPTFGIRAHKLAKGVLEAKDGTRLYYDPQDPAARGSFGRFFECVLADGRVMGAKEVVLQAPKNNPETKPYVTREVALQRELAFMRRASSAIAPTKVLVTARKVGAEYKDNKVLLVMPLMEACLFDRLHSLPRDPRRGLMMVEMAEALATELQRIHARGMVHCDIKPDNILINNIAGTNDDPRRFALADYGLTRDLRDPLDFPGTVAFSAPEVLTGRSIDRSADMWSLGVTLLQSLTGYNPFQDEDNSGAFTAMRHQEWAQYFVGQPTDPVAHQAFSLAIGVVRTLDTHCGTQWRKLLGHMLNPDPTKRVSPTQVLRTLRRHPLSATQQASAHAAWKTQATRDLERAARIARLRKRWADDVRSLQVAL